MRKRIIAFKYAFRGLKSAFMQDVPLRIHFAAATLVFSMGFYFRISRSEWFMLMTVCALVISAELVNTAIERLCDTLHPEKSDNIKFVKDVSAGAVLVTVMLAVITGGLIFWPYLFS